MALFCLQPVQSKLSNRKDSCQGGNCDTSAAYCLQEFKNLISEGHWGYFDKRMAYKTLDDLDWENEQLVEVLGRLDSDDYQKTFPDCEVHNLPGQLTIHGDQYGIYWHPETKTRRRGPEDGTLALSLKIAIATRSNGICAGIVTLHPSR